MSPKKKKIDSDNDSKQRILNMDLLRSILERLSFLDFHRARCVSLEWYSASKSCPTNPSLLLFPNECNNNKGSCQLFDPRRHDTHTLTDLGFDLAASSCLASSGNWFLMVDGKTSFLLLNLFTREKIPLPSLIADKRLGKAVLWVDEKSGDYLVVWNFDDSSFAYHKKGDDNKSWKVFQPLQKAYVDMVLKEGKLYVLSETRNIFFIDFSGGRGYSLKECEVNSTPTPQLYHRRQYYLNLAVTLSGEILVIASHVEPCPGICFFDVYKMDPKSSKWSIIKSIGDEVLLLDLGITVAAKGGALRNCIYFSDDQSHRHERIGLSNDAQSQRRKRSSLTNDDNRICIYHIQTDQVLQRFQSLPMPLKDARWFLPSFGSEHLH